MPLYQQMILTMPKFKTNLVNLFRLHAKVVMEYGGTVRGIEHHGVRPLQERATRLAKLFWFHLHHKVFYLYFDVRKYAAVDGTRHFWSARFITVTFDASPTCLREAERILRNDESVLRFYCVKQVSSIDKCNTRTWKNPFLNVRKSTPSE